MSIITLYISILSLMFFFFFFNDTATTEIYTLSLHDALPISRFARGEYTTRFIDDTPELFRGPRKRSEEHTSELQSQSNLVCRLLLEKKKKHNKQYQAVIQVDNLTQRDCSRTRMLVLSRQVVY